tara:strand:- start:306544 stop:306930 length:387 start_codon:yes stop_codon:yes gene_type:complete
MTVKEWSKNNGTYSDYSLPAEVINSNACLLKPLDGETLQSTKDILNFIKQNMTADHNRKIPFSQLPKLLEAVGDRYSVFLVKPCEFTATPCETSKHSDSVILGYVSKSQSVLAEKAYTYIKMNQFIEK